MLKLVLPVLLLCAAGPTQEEGTDARAKAVAAIEKVGGRVQKLSQDSDAVLVGYIYRWREREGTDYGVTRAASVSLDLHLIRPSNGAILWKGKFDKTQQSLSENLFDLGTFTESGGKWLTVDKLAAIGFDKMLKDMPSGEGSAR